MTVEREGEFWPTRIGMLAGLAHVDALAIVRAERDPEALLERATMGLARGALGLSDVARQDRKRVGGSDPTIATSSSRPCATAIT